MKKNLNISICNFIFISILVLFVSGESSLAQQAGHNFDGKCPMCHLNSKGEKGVLRTVFVKEIFFQCYNCHNKLELSHITEIKPTMTIPEQFPLDSMGRLTCATCHNVHGKENHLLHSKTSGKKFCYLCHKEGLKNSINNAGLFSFPDPYRKYEIIDEEIIIDRLSSQCIGCHDSEKGKGTDIGIGIWLHKHGSSHPIGVDYMKAYSKGGFNHPSLFHSNIRLFNGMVGCATCHDSASRAPAYLVTDNKGGDLCLECHRD